MGWLTRCGIWISRIGHARGFGIHSPNDFSFVRDVIGEKLPYYAYSSIAEKCRGESRLTKKLCRLFFRVSNFIQPACVVDLAPQTGLWSASMRMGCRKARLQTLSDLKSLDFSQLQDKRSIIRIDATHIPDVMSRISEIPASCVMIVLYIHQDAQCYMNWQKLAHNDDCRVVFDLYHSAIIFFDKKRYKQKYTINY